VTIKISSGSAAKAANAIAAAVFLGVDSMISMYFRLFSLIFFAQMTVVYIPTTITLSRLRLRSTVISNGLALKMSRYCLG
jgi:hypothetical protein